MGTRLEYTIADTQSLKTIFLMYTHCNNEKVSVNTQLFSHTAKRGNPTAHTQVEAVPAAVFYCHSGL